MSGDEVRRGWGEVAVPGKMNGTERAARAMVLKGWDGMEWREGCTVSIYIIW